MARGIARCGFAALWPALVGALCACTDQTKLREAELTELLSALPGRYDNSAQVQRDAQQGARPAHEPVALIVVRVYTPRLGHHVLYAQEMAADDPRRVMSEKMFSFQVDEKRGIVETVYTFVEPLRWRDGQRNTELFTSVVTEDVQPECELMWKKDVTRFTASADPVLCPDAPPPAPGESLAELTPGALTLAGYRFRKTR
jgi:hypothetical protein